MTALGRSISLGLLAGATLFVATPAHAQTTGCRAPAAGALPKAVKVPKKDRGKFSIETAPRIAALVPQTVCDTAAKVAAGGVASTQGPALGLSSQVLNTSAGRLDLIAMPGVEAELQKVLASFAAAWPYTPLARQPRILFRASDAYDAYALPDNSIVLSMGVLQSAESDSEVLFVLAHEYSHLLMGHHLTSESSGGGSRGLLGAVSTIYVAGSFVSQMRSNRGSLSALDLNKVETATKKAAALTEALRFAMDDVFTPNWSHEQEDEADALALDLLIRSNSSIDSYANVFARLQKLMDQQSASRTKNRAAAEGMEKALAATMKQLTSPQFLGSITSGNPGGFARMGGKLALGLGMSALSGGSSSVPRDTHLPPEERRKGLAAYFQAGYPTADPPIDTGGMVRRYKAQPDYKRVIPMKDAYLKARQAYFAQDYSGALTGLQAIGAGTRTAPTFVNFMAALAARDMGNSAQAKLFYEAGRSGAGIPSVQLFESYAEANISDRDFAGSQAVLNDASTRFRDPDHFRSIGITRYVAEGNDGLAASNYATCQQVKGREYILARCKAAYPQAAAAAEAKKPKIRIPGLPF
jgi:Zn-dependent protease with chaperone function